MGLLVVTNLEKIIKIYIYDRQKKHALKHSLSPYKDAYEVPTA